MRTASYTLVLFAGLMLAGCGIVGEERMHYMKKDWERIKGPFWGQSEESLSLNEIVPTAKRTEAENEKQICLHKNGSERVMMQDGVSDQVAYRRCVLAPYQTDAGSRMGNRPDGNGAVVN